MYSVSVLCYSGRSTLIVMHTNCMRAVNAISLRQEPLHDFFLCCKEGRGNSVAEKGTAVSPPALRHLQNSSLYRATQKCGVIIQPTLTARPRVERVDVKVERLFTTGETRHTRKRRKYKKVVGTDENDDQLNKPVIMGFFTFFQLVICIALRGYVPTRPICLFINYETQCHCVHCCPKHRSHTTLIRHEKRQK